MLPRVFSVTYLLFHRIMFPQDTFIKVTWLNTDSDFPARLGNYYHTVYPVGWFSLFVYYSFRFHTF